MTFAVEVLSVLALIAVIVWRLVCRLSEWIYQSEMAEFQQRMVQSAVNMELRHRYLAARKANR